MSLTKLPLELVNDILSYLEVVDKKCFALACKKFEAYFPSCRRQSGPSSNLKEGTKAELLQLLEFLRRLQRAGNIFHGACPENHLCSNCARFRPKHFFPLTTMRFNIELTCLECTMLLIMSAVGPGTKITMTTRWGFDSTSYNCLQGISHDATHGGHDEYGRKICEDCHLNTCDDIGCAG